MTAGITGTVTSSDGIALRTRHWPAEPSRAGMLIVHGLAEHSGRYEHVGSHFAESGFDTWAFDLRGFGGSEGRRAYVESFDEYLDDVAARLDEVRSPERPVVLLGHSLGGLIALDYALSDRPSPDFLVLSSPALGADIPAPKRLAAKILPLIAPRLAVPNGLRGEQLSSDPAVGEAYFADPHVYPKTTARLGAAILDAMSQTRPRIGALRIPTLVIHGAADTVVPPQFSAPLGEIAGVERVLFPKFRHESFNEVDGGQALDVITRWLTDRLNG